MKSKYVISEKGGGGIFYPVADFQIRVADFQIRKIRHDPKKLMWNQIPPARIPPVGSLHSKSDHQIPPLGQQSFRKPFPPTQIPPLSPQSCWNRIPPANQNSDRQPKFRPTQNSEKNPIIQKNSTIKIENDSKPKKFPNTYCRKLMWWVQCTAQWTISRRTDGSSSGLDNPSVSNCSARERLPSVGR